MKTVKKSLRNPLRRPTHPGAILREDILPALAISQSALAEYLGVSRLTVSEILLEKRSISAEMALRISKTVGGSPESWLQMQSAVDLWDVTQRFKADPKNLRFRKCYLQCTRFTLPQYASYRLR